MDSWSQRSFPTFFSTFASCSHCPKLLPLSLELPVEFSVFTASFFNLANSCWTPALPGAQSWALRTEPEGNVFQSLPFFPFIRPCGHHWPWFLIPVIPSLGSSPPLHKLFETLCLYHLCFPCGSLGQSLVMMMMMATYRYVLNVYQERDRFKTPNTR